MAKKFMYMGKELSELTALSLDELKPYLPSRARRLVRRMPVEYKKFVAKVRKRMKALEQGKELKPIRAHLREAVILPEWVGLTFAIHNGKEFKNVVIDERMIGRRLGEFSHTTRNVVHSGPGVGATRGSKYIPLK
ncbi:MAG: 30S ribosomal protein S19 [Candidatus Micrarchaeota archaeon]|nr:30S ribosomal protein S19 [Candidatus Micrarchaeota archaeon]